MGELLMVYAAASLWFRMPAQENEILWKTIGFAGLGIFGTRFLVQWIHSERHKESKIPNIFWWQSLCGTLFCLVYFLRQHDLVGICGYSLNIIPYTRNIMLIYSKKPHVPIMKHDESEAPSVTG
jgi:lipid-A-disaccharide synthase-like uncharacterized protein